jgi:hypothetical protein
VCQQTISTAGQTTAMMQQFRSLSKKFREAEMKVDPKPRMQFTIDLQAWLEKKNRDGYSIILSIDANEELTEQGQLSPLNFN